ncbi:HDOD domain-containing protein [Chitinivibrio alkaliphilus]|uniref:HDOD domain-containing protein n=1 Tax=Chitinivibrio alkaliphilus ACht1 TaxID=1313304 RepID=U7D8Q9_9BACT|nr:HDOD domain-containing protein [Chitinivibrio alkaliphilus]ERP31961.1 HDOD domain-containing protein [Chitinivibrio alkaliphilus ACht1]
MAKNPMISAYISDAHEKKVLSVIFETYGYTFREVKNLKTAYVSITQQMPHALIFELTEYLNDQINLIRQVTENRRTRQIPIICYGDHADEITLNLIRNSGVKNYYQRPLTTDILKGIISHSHLDGHSVEAQEKYKGELEDNTRIMNRATPPVQRIEIMVKRIGDLLAFPFTIAKVMQVTQSETTGAKDLAKAIEADPVVVSNILKVSNSVAYGRSGRRISSIRDAIVRLGFDETKHIAISLSVMNLFSDEDRSIGFSREHFWFHSLATAIIAAKIARKSGLSPPDTAFIAGLMHDFGIILLDEFFPAYLLYSLEVTNQQGDSFIAVQNALWGMSHIDVVVQLFHSWNLPEEIIETIKYAEHFASYEKKGAPANTHLVQIIGISEVIAKSKAFGRECDEFVSSVPNEILESLKIPVKITESFFQSITDEIDLFSTYLSIKNVVAEYSPEEEISIAFVDSHASLYSPHENYLITQGYRVHLLSTPEECRDFDPPIQCIVLHPRTKEEILHYISHITKQEDPIPMVILHKHSADLPQKDSISYLPESIDLRVFIFAVESLAMGHPFSFIPQEIPKEEYTPIRETRAFQFSAEVIESSMVLMRIGGTAEKENREEIKKIMAMLLKKTRHIAVDFSTAEQVHPAVISLLEKIHSSLSQLGGGILLCIQNKETTLPQEIQQKLTRYESTAELLQKTQGK